MLIFDGFPDLQKANEFASKVQEDYPDRTTAVYDNADDACKVDPFPFELDGIVVHVSRNNPTGKKEWAKNIAEEKAIQTLAPTFGGEFAGT